MKSTETLEVWDYLTRNGLVVAIGDPAKGKKSAVFVEWCMHGEELVLLDIVRACGNEEAKVIDTRDMLLGDFLQWRERARKSEAWSHGKFYRSGEATQVFKPRAQSRRSARGKRQGSLRVAA
jgi:hypothetical protein